MIDRAFDEALDSFVDELVKMIDARYVKKPDDGSGAHRIVDNHNRVALAMSFKRLVEFVKR